MASPTSMDATTKPIMLIINSNAPNLLIEPIFFVVVFVFCLLITLNGSGLIMVFFFKKKKLNLYWDGTVEV
jgi:hypothetical protein